MADNIGNKAAHDYHLDVPVAQALGEEALLRGRHVQMVVVGGLVSDCVWHSAYSLLNAGVRQGVFHRRSISSSHLAMFI